MTATLVPGTRFAGFLLEAELGRGGMAVVWKARDERLGREVALKVIDASVVEPSFVERFRREAHVWSAISDQNVVTVHAAGAEGHWLFLAMELLPGGSLLDRLKRDGKIPWRDAARLIAATARGLAAIHERGYVHRDVKPDNILLDALGRPKLADFGIARAVDGASRLTRTQEAVGTIAYMAPEQADGGKADARSDLYALGATLHALVAGAPPFQGGPSYVVFKKKLMDAPPRLSSLVPGAPAELDALVRRLLAPDPAARGSANALDLAHELDAIAAGGATPLPRTRSRALVVAVAGALVVAGAVVSLAFTLRGRAPDAPSVPSTGETPARLAPAPSPAAASPAVTPAPLARLRVTGTLDLGDEKVSGLVGMGLACGQRLGAAGTNRGDLVVFSLSDLRVVSRVTVASPELGGANVCGIAFLDDDAAVVACSDHLGKGTSVVVRYDVTATFGVARRWGQTLRPRAIDVAVSEGARSVLVACQGMLLALDMGTGEQAGKREERDTQFSVARAGGDRVWTTDRAGRLLLWDSALERAPLVVFAPPRPPRSEEGARIAVAADGRYVAVWGNGALRKGGPGEGEVATVGTVASPLGGLAISRDGTRALTAKRWGGVQLWDVQRGKTLAQVELPRATGVSHVAFLPNGRGFLATTNDGKVRRFEPEGP